MKAPFTAPDAPAPSLPEGHVVVSAPQLRDVRCACNECGAHVTAWVGHTVSGTCSVCGSYDLRPLD